ncbi:MAG: hypothetical protein C4547_11710 [Phycisphaerales bacterium]|nr:MAG: hypothetical protein C4547_11710 [Phycisphaerales bacterium]
MVHCFLTLLYLVPSMPVPPPESDPLANTDAAVWTPPRDPSGVSAPQKVRARMTAVGTLYQYVALWLDGDGRDQIYVKVEQSRATGSFNEVGFYHGEGAGGWPGMTGGAAFISLDSYFKSADMAVEHDGLGNVRVTFSNLDPPGPDQVYERGGWAPRNGTQVGIAGINGTAAIDDFSFGAHGICDRFNRPDGPLGDDWELKAGTHGVIRDGRAFVGLDRVRARFAYVGACSPTCAYTLKQSRARSGCSACPPVGSEYRTSGECDSRRDCPRKIRTRIDCPDGAGSCKLKGKQSRCN